MSLSKGSFAKIQESVVVKNPIVQVTNITAHENVPFDASMARYYLTIYDGDLHRHALLRSRHNNLVIDGQLKINSIIRMNEYEVTFYSEDYPKFLVNLIEFEIVGEMKIWLFENNSQEIEIEATPVYTDDEDTMSGIEMGTLEPEEPSQAITDVNNNLVEPRSSTMPRIVRAESLASSIRQPLHYFNGHRIIPIKMLSPLLSKWSIKGRVIRKTDIKSWKNLKGEGHLFSFDLKDASAEIKVLGFYSSVDRYFEAIENGKIYYISNGTVRRTNTDYSSTKNRYEIVIQSDTVILQSDEDDASMPKPNIHLISLAEIKNKNLGDCVDVIGIVIKIGAVSEIITKKDEKVVKKRDFVLVDESMTQILCTLWGETAENFQIVGNPIILIQNAKISEFNEKSLTVMRSSTLKIDPNISEAKRLQEWYQSQIDRKQLMNVSRSSSLSTISKSTTHSNLICLEKLKDSLLDGVEEFITTTATIINFGKRYAIYMACPQPYCNKKVIQRNSGMYRCENCEKDYEQFKWRIVLKLKITDHTSAVWLSCFQRVTEGLLGLNEEEIIKLKDEKEFEERIESILFKKFNFKLKAQCDMFNNERRLNVIANQITPIDYVASGKQLMDKITRFQQTV